jgi:hypothetical protein
MVPEPEALEELGVVTESEQAPALELQALASRSFDLASE